jgi:hypothetical protein
VTVLLDYKFKNTKTPGRPKILWVVYIENQVFDKNEALKKIKEEVENQMRTLNGRIIHPTMKWTNPKIMGKLLNGIEKYKNRITGKPYCIREGHTLYQMLS